MGELISQYQDFVAPLPQPHFFEETVSLSIETSQSSERRGDAMQYDPSFDQNLARELVGIKGFDPITYQEKEREFDRYIERQVRSMQGERLGLEISDLNYRIVDGKLTGEDLSTPLEEVYRVGLDHLRVHGRPVDREREEAEVMGFLKIQDIFTDALIEKEDLIVFHGSPEGGEGSMYHRRFYDMFRMKRDGTIQGARFNAGQKEVAQALSGLTSVDKDVVLPVVRSAEALLANPILIRSDLSLDAIHRRLQGNSDLMSRERFNSIMQKVAPLVDEYKESLKNDPNNTQDHHLHLNAIMNAVDIEAEKDDSENDQIYGYSSRDVYDLGMMPVRLADTGCGPSGGFAVGGFGSPMGVMDTGLMMMGSFSGSLGEKTLSCVCPFCKQRVNAVIAAGTISCPNPNCKKVAPYNC